jgi:hypothetical protein
MKLFTRTAGTGTEPVEPVEVPKPKTPAQLAREAEVSREIAIKDAEAKARLDEIERAARFKREQEERERDQWRETVKAEKKTETGKIKRTAVRDRLNKVVPYAPLILVNIAAISGQIGWALDHLAIGDAGSPVRIIAAVLFGITAETIALFLQYYANRALLNRDSAGSLYLAAFMVAGLVASINFSHWSNPDDGEFFGSPNATAVVFALFSFVSPWLWRIHNRAEFREMLRENGEIDARAVKLSLARKIMYPVRSFQVIRLAAWQGETNPARAVEMYETRRIAKATVKAARDAEKAQVKTTKEIEAPAPTETPKAVTVPPSAGNAMNGRRDLTAHTKWNDGMATYAASVHSGSPLNTRELAAALGQKNKVLASAIIRHYKEGQANQNGNGRPATVSQSA